MMRRRSVVAVAAVAAFAAGCGSASPEPTAPTSAPVTAPPPPHAAPPARRDTDTPTSGSVQIEDRILKACGDIPTAHFAFDSARLQPDAAAALNALARCFSTGPLKGHGMKLIGHADPRGEFEYNMALGQRRAGSVAGYLGGHGVERSRIAVSSRGALDAVGTDDEGWARDRKVDVLLAD